MVESGLVGYFLNLLARLEIIAEQVIVGLAALEFHGCKVGCGYKETGMGLQCFFQILFLFGRSIGYIAIQPEKLVTRK